VNPQAAPGATAGAAGLPGGPAPASVPGFPGLGPGSSPGNILVIQLARLGDLVQTWPLLTRLRQAYPGARLTLLTDRRVLALSGIGPQVDEALGFDFPGLASLAPGNWQGAYRLVADLLKDLRSRDFGLVFNLNFSRLSLILTHLLDAPAKGYLPARGGRDFSREPWPAWIYSLVHARRYNRFHLTDVFRHLAPEADGAPAPPQISIPRGGEPRVALQLATRHARRTWPLEHFTRLAEFLVRRREARVLLLGSRAERPLGERLRAALPPNIRERVANLQGATDLQELAGELRETRLLVSGDTGTLHLAAALGVPTAALFLGPALCFETGPYGEGHYVLQAEPPCHPCLEASSPCPEGSPICLDMLPPLEVARFVAGLPAERGAPRIALPAGARVYRSGLDAFGAHYQYLGEDPPRFADLVGEAYRRAGAWLAGTGELGEGCREAQIPAPSPKTPPPIPYRGKEDISMQTTGLLTAVLAGSGQGQGIPPAMPEAAAALRPLTAFREEMRRQGREELFAGAKALFVAQLESFLQNAR